MYDVVRHANAREFLERSEPWLLSAEDQHNLILSLSYARSRTPEQQPDALFATVHDGGSVVGCALRTPPYKLLITDLPSGAAGPLAASVADAYEEIPAVLGPPVAAEAVAMAWVAAKGGDWHPGLEQGVYRLDTVRAPAGVPGRLREAGVDDVDLAIEWGEGFVRDAGVQFRLRRASIERWVERRQLYLWDDDGPRSITVAQGHTPGGVRVGYVYTPPEWRGRGYAGSCVAAVSQRMLDGGSSFCVLYTDLSNYTSNELYKRLGYELIAKVRDYDLVPEEAL